MAMKGSAASGRFELRWKQVPGSLSFARRKNVSSRSERRH